jgi:hypothetical protein
MNKHTYLQEDEMIQRAIDALMGTLGPIETARFLNLPRQRKLDSVMRHRLWQDGLEPATLFDQVFGPPPPTAPIS